MSGEPESARLADEAAIRRVLLRYARGCDRLDVELVRACYWEDAIEDRGRYVGGVDGFLEWLWGQLESFESTWHQIGQPLIELAGDTAWVETYSLAHHRLRDESGAPFSRLIPTRYCDRFERRGGEWRIADRVGVYEATLLVEAAPSFDAEPRSRRSREDPAYRRTPLTDKGGEG